MQHCIADEGWDVTGYAGLFYPLSKPSCDRLKQGRVQVVKAGGWRVFVVEIGHFYLKNRGSFYHLVTVFKVITHLHLAPFFPFMFYVYMRPFGL